MEKTQAIHCLVTGAVGDALGYIKDHGRGAGRITGFRSFTANKGGQYQHYRCPIRSGEYTDDTEYTLATAASVQSNFQADPCIVEAHLAYYTAFGTTGGAAMGAMGRKVRGRQSSMYDSPSSLFYAGKLPYWEQKATGVVMRIAPLALALDDCVNAVYDNGILTHGSPEALVTGVMHAYVLQKLSEGLTLPDAMEAMVEARDALMPTSMRMNEWQMLYKSKAKRSFIDDCKTILEQARDQWQTISNVPFQFAVRHAPTQKALDSWMIALALLAADNPLLAGANYPARIDADTVLAMTGQMLGVQNTDNAFSQLEQDVQDMEYIASIAAHMFKIREGQEQPICLEDDWKCRMEAKKGMWHPFYGEAEVVQEHPQKGKFAVKEIKFPKGKTMMIKVK